MDENRAYIAKTTEDMVQYKVKKEGERMSMYQTFAEVYDRFMNEQTEAFAPYVIRLLSDFAAEAPARVLDIGCGTGKTAIALAKNGYRVVGGDISHAMLEKAVQNARAENVSVCFQ